MAGETTSVANSASKLFYDNPGAGAFLCKFSAAYLSTETELNDVMQAGYIGPHVRVVAVGYYPTDLDTGIAAVVQKVTINGVDAVTGLTGAQTGTSSWNPVTTTFAGTAPGTAPQLVQIQTTTAAATGAAGTVILELLCQKI